MENNSTLALTLPLPEGEGKRGRYRLSSNLQRREVFQNLQPHRLALFRVELRRHHVVAPDRGDERAAVVGRRGDDLLVIRYDVIAVDEVDAAAPPWPAGEAAKERRGALDLELVPAHVRDF